MQYNLSGQDFRSNNNYPKRPKKSSIWENIWLRFWAPFFVVCSLVQLSMSVVLFVNVVQPLALVACICSGLPAPCRRKLQLSSFPQRFSAAAAFQTPGERNRAGALRDSRNGFQTTSFLSLRDCPALCNIDPRSTHSRREIIVYISDTVEMRLLSTTGTCPGGRQYRSTPKPWDWRKIQVLITIRE